MAIQVESMEFLSTSDCPDFLWKAEKRLKEEIERVQSYLDASSEAKITSVVEQEVLGEHMKTLLEMENSGIVKLLTDDKYSDLSRMYSLLRRIETGLKLMCTMMQDHLKTTGKNLVTDVERQKDPVDFVQKLLDMKDKFAEIISSSFSNDKYFQNTLNQAFEYFINLNTRSPEFISLFVDDKLRKGMKGMPEEDIEKVFDKVMILFRYLQEKDVFEKYYKGHLAKRLLSGRTVRCSLHALTFPYSCQAYQVLVVLCSFLKTQNVA